MSLRYHRTGQDRFRQPMPPHRRRHMHGAILPMAPPPRIERRGLGRGWLIGGLFIFAGFVALGFLFGMLVR